uniref:Uncharacterized protein n=1 Tax=Anguilla anguilla TaxID=7936 RepID=A0A0E9XVZ5_ANGAN
MTTQTASTERIATQIFLGRTVLGYWRCSLHHFPTDKVKYMNLLAAKRF